MPANASPTCHLVDLERLVPTPWTTRQMVPASASQSASVSGMSSPSGRGSTRTNWPACADCAITGDWTTNSWMPSLSSAVETICCAVAAHLGVRLARGHHGAHHLRRDVDRRRRSRGPPPGRRRPPDRRRAAARRVAAGVDARRAWSPASRRRPSVDRAPLGGVQPRLGVLDDRVGGVAERHDHQVGRDRLRLPGRRGPPPAGLVRLAELHHVERRRRDEAGLVVAEELRRRRAAPAGRCPPRARGAAPRRGRASPPGCAGRRW